jgi:hypothetical protein
LDEPKTIRSPSDIRGLPAKFGDSGGSHFAVIRGDSGFITAAAGAKVAIISRWNVMRSGAKPDGSPRLRFRAQFSYLNDTLMSLKVNGLPLQKRVVVQMRTKRGVENVDILGWEEWRLEGGVLTLEDVFHTAGKIVSQRGIVPE